MNGKCDRVGGARGVLANRKRITDHLLTQHHTCLTARIGDHGRSTGERGDG